MRNTLLLILVICCCLGLTSQEAEVIYKANNCKANFPSTEEVCYKCNDNQACIIDPEVFLHYKPEWDNEEPPEEPPEGVHQEIDGAISFPSIMYDINNGWNEVDGWLSTPDEGINLVDISGASLTYKISVSGGSYYLWIEGSSGNISSDSIHFGIDGQLLGSITFINNSWSNELQLPNYGDRAIIEIVAGEHDLNLWMREDGTTIKNIILTKDENYDPRDG